MSELNQTAKERVQEWISNDGLNSCLKDHIWDNKEFFVAEITAAEQAAFAKGMAEGLRGKEMSEHQQSYATGFEDGKAKGRREEREHWKAICKEVSYNNGNQHPIRTATAIGIQMRAEGKIPPWSNDATDPPAQPAATEPATQLECPCCEGRLISTYQPDPRFKRCADCSTTWIPSKPFISRIEDLERRVTALEGKSG